MTTDASQSLELPEHPDPQLARMGFRHLSHDTHALAMTDLVFRLSFAREPQQVMEVFRRSMNQIFGRRALLTLSAADLPEGQYRITRFHDDQDHSLGETDNPWANPGAMTVHEGGFLGRLIRDGEAKLAWDLQVKGDPVLGDKLAGYRSMMATPAFTEGRATHWAMNFSREPRGFTTGDLEELILRANLIGASIKHMTTQQQLQQANDRVRLGIEQIGEIQRALLPATLPDVPGLDMAVSYKLFDQAGGDLYDVALLNIDDPKGPWMILIGDVSGHGPGAAVMMAMLNAILAARPADLRQPDRMLAFANEHVCAKGLGGMFVTAFLGIYDPATRRLTYANAGHHPPLIKSPDRTDLVHLDGASDLPLGIMPGVSYHQASYELSPGQTLLLYTDGITEATDHDGRMFEVDGLERALIHCTGEPTCAVGHINEELEKHQGGHQPSDDQTLLAIRVRD